MSLADHLRRKVGPSTVVRLSRWRAPLRLRAALRRALGKGPSMQLFFAYDDPYAAIAMPGLLLIAAKHRAQLAIYPLREHGIDGDPAAQQRRVHAVRDSLRLAQRDGRALSRLAPPEVRDCSFLAEWTEAARGKPGMATFAAEALEQLWFKSSGPVARESYQALRQKHLGQISESGTVAQLARNGERLHKLGHWESPAVLVEGEWFFAHERLEQIEAHLQDLGW